MRHLLEKVCFIDPNPDDSTFVAMANLAKTEAVPNRDIMRVKDVMELYPLIVNPKIKIDLIAVSVSSFKKSSEDLYVNISAIKTLIAGSCVIGDGVIRPRDTKIMLLISDDIDRMILTEALDIPDVLIGFSPGGSFTMKDIQEHTAAVDSGDWSVPQKIRDLLKPKKKDKSSNDSQKITLTYRQNQIYKLISTRGASNKAIAKTLKISESTVKLHISAILKKYGVRNRTQLAVFSKKDPAQDASLV